MRRWTPKQKNTGPVNTLDAALRSAECLVQDLSDQASPAYQRYRIFSALAADDPKGLIAFLIWHSRGEMLQELNANRQFTFKPC